MLKRILERISTALTRLTRFWREWAPTSHSADQADRVRMPGGNQPNIAHSFASRKGLAKVS